MHIVLVTYIGLTENEFKTRFNLHKSSFKLEHKRTTTTLSDHIWKLKNKNTDFSNKWEFVENVKPYAPGEKIMQAIPTGEIFDPHIEAISDTMCTENSFFSTTSKTNTHLPQVNNNSGSTVPTNNSVV